MSETTIENDLLCGLRLWTLGVNIINPHDGEAQLLITCKSPSAARIIAKDLFKFVNSHWKEELKLANEKVDEADKRLQTLCFKSSAVIAEAKPKPEAKSEEEECF